MDKITLERIALLHPKLRAEASEIYAEICEAVNGKALCRFSQTLRSWEQQAALYAQGRTAPGKIVTNAKPGFSFHNYGLAIDIVLVLDKDGNGSFESASWDTRLDANRNGKADWMEVVTIFKQHGWEWGGDWNFKDLPHFQKTFGYNIRQLQYLYNNKNFVDSKNYYVKL